MAGNSLPTDHEKVSGLVSHCPLTCIGTHVFAVSSLFFGTTVASGGS